MLKNNSLSDAMLGATAVLNNQKTVQVLIALGADDALTQSELYEAAAQSANCLASDIVELRLNSVRAEQAALRLEVIELNGCVVLEK